jgi:hypothetical protein
MATGCKFYLSKLGKSHDIAGSIDPLHHNQLSANQVFVEMQFLAVIGLMRVEAALPVSPYCVLKM